MGIEHPGEQHFSLEKHIHKGDFYGISLIFNWLQFWDFTDLTGFSSKFTNKGLDSFGQLVGIHGIYPSVITHGNGKIT
jgi:hypothetical protein